MITELHVWILAVRVMADVNNGKEMRDILIEMMWRDYELRTKKLGVRKKTTSFLKIFLFQNLFSFGIKTCSFF